MPDIEGASTPYEKILTDLLVAISATTRKKLTSMLGTPSGVSIVQVDVQLPESTFSKLLEGCPNYSAPCDPIASVGGVFINLSLGDSSSMLSIFNKGEE